MGINDIKSLLPDHSLNIDRQKENADDLPRKILSGIHQR